MSGNLRALKAFRFQIEHKARFAMAMIAGILLAMAFPKFGIAGLAWVAPGCLLIAAGGAPGGLAFRIGFGGGLAYALTAFYWLLYIPVKFLPVAGWIALSCYLALYPAMWVWLAWKTFPSQTPLPYLRAPLTRELAEAIRDVSWGARTLWVVQCAATWVALEMVLARFLSGMPWDLLGVSQFRMVPLLQIASFTGVYGVSFLIVWFSVALLCAGIAITKHPPSRAGWAREIALPFLALLLTAFFGLSEIRNYKQPTTTTAVALVQPSIPQTLIWDEAENENRFRQLIALSEKALETNPDILIWPEASVPNMIRHHEETGRAVRNLSREHEVWTILGSDDAELRPGGTTLKDVDYYNSAFAISPEGELSGRYRKRRLVIFGEYVPFVKQLPFLRFFSPAGESGFTPGEEPIPFHLDTLGIKTSVLICFEDIFPHLVREYVENDTDFLINITNNGWFGESAAQWQHAASAAIRAVENKIPLVRCANNGLTCWVDPLGRMHEVFFPESDDIYQAGFKTAEIPILPEGAKRELTFYTRNGDIFGWSCVGWITLRLVSGALAGVRSRNNS